MPRSSLLVPLAVVWGCAPFIAADDHECNLIGVCDTDTDTDTDASQLLGPLGECNIDSPGATVFVKGELTVDATDPDDRTVSGVEEMLVFANDTWSAEGGTDCSHVFEVVGTASDDLELTVTLYRLGDSSCDVEEVTVLDQYSWVYRIEQGAGDEVTVYFNDTAVLGTGTWDGEMLRYLSAGFCTRL